MYTMKKNNADKARSDERLRRYKHEHWGRRVAHVDKLRLVGASSTRSSGQSWQQADTRAETFTVSTSTSQPRGTRPAISSRDTNKRRGKIRNPNDERFRSSSRHTVFSSSSSSSSSSLSSSSSSSPRSRSPSSTSSLSTASQMPAKILTVDHIYAYPASLLSSTHNFRSHASTIDGGMRYSHRHQQSQNKSHTKGGVGVSSGGSNRVLPSIMGYIKGLQYNDRVALDDEGAQEREYARSKMSHWGAARERRCRRRQEEEASNRLYAENELRHRLLEKDCLGGGGAVHRSLIRHSKIIHSSDSNDRNGCGSSAATDTVDVVGGRGEKRCYTSSHNEGINGLSANIPRTTLSIPVPSPLPSTPTTVAVTVNLSSPSSSTLPLSSPSAQSLASSPSPRVLGFAGSSNSDSQPSPPTRNKGLRVLQHTESDNETAHSTHTHALTSHSATKNIKMNNKSNKTNSNRNNRKSNSNHITTINSSTNFQRVFAQGNGSDPDAAVRSAQAFLERKKQDQSSSQPISPASITHLHNSTANNLTGEGISGNPGGCASNPASPSSGYLSHSPRSRPAPRCSSPRDYSNMSWHTGGSGDVTGSGDRRHATWATENQGNGSGHNIGRNRYYLRARGKGSTDPARGKRNIIQDQDKIRNKSGVFENITKRGRAPASVHRGGSGTEEQKGRGASLHRQLQHKSEKRKERRKAPSTNEANHDKDKTLKVETKSSPQPVVSGAGAKVEAEASAEAEAESKAEARVGDADMKLIKNVSFTLIPSGVSDLSSFPLLRYTASTHPHP